MSLLTEVQQALLSERASIGTALLKLRYLASRIGSDLLEEWVTHEIEGYFPNKVPVPSYRVAGIIYNGTFTTGYQTIKNVPIASSLIEKYAGKHWLNHEIRQGLQVLEDIIVRSDKGVQYSIDTGNLIPRLQGNVYEGMTCINVNGIFDITAFVNVQASVRAKVLDLTLKLDKEVPAAAEITVRTTVTAVPPADAEKVTRMARQVFYGPVVMNTGTAGSITVNVTQGNVESLIGELVSKGLPQSDARELAEIVRSEAPESEAEPLGATARNWLGEKAKAGGSIVWGMAKGVATAVVAEAVKQYYGVK